MPEWRKCVGIPEYEASSAGEIRSIYTRRPLVGGLDKDGYRKLVVCSGGKRLHRRVSALVCEAFHGPRPAGQVVRHLDGTRDNDSADNLAWSTQKENIADKVAHGTSQTGERHGMAKLTEAKVREILASTLSGPALARAYGVSRSSIYSITSGRTWAYLQP